MLSPVAEEGADDGAGTEAAEEAPPTAPGATSVRYEATVVLGSDDREVSIV